MVQSTTFTARDGKPMFYYYWPAQVSNPTRGVLQIVHGLGEHAARYGHLAAELQRQGIAVYANDHRGHGRTEVDPNLLGYFEEGSFWEKTIDDLHELTALIKANHPETPIFLLGHSLGSMLTRDYITRFGEELNGVLLSGTGSYQYFVSETANLYMSTLATFKGRKQGSKLVKSLFFEQCNRAFKPTQTQFDWISRDKEVVHSFLNDKYRTEDFTVGFSMDFIGGVKKVNQKQMYQRTPKDLPIFIFSGDQDPIGEAGKGVKKVYQSYQKAGIKNVEYKLYEGGRHEMLNETNRAEVFEDVLSWLNKQL